MKENSTNKCPLCSGPMSHFKGYIPRMGNVCKMCYDKLVQEDEFPTTNLEKQE